MDCPPNKTGLPSRRHLERVDTVYVFDAAQREEKRQCRHKVGPCILSKVVLDASCESRCAFQSRRQQVLKGRGSDSQRTTFEPEVFGLIMLPTDIAVEVHVA